jgi:hypothetical protein
MIMAKQKTKKQTPSLNPEKYIRQKARNLPLYKCWITTDWKKERFASIAIARKHTNDNLTICNYLVDLGCLGVKDTDYLFNIPPKKFNDFIKDTEMKYDDTIPYSLVHNIIYSAIEYAEEYGFKPHKDFTQTTCFFLEEDTDDIPLEAVECGSEEDGKPIYINTGFDSPARAKQIIAQLEKTAGKGNFHYIDIVEGGYDTFDDDEEEESYEESKAIFLEQSQLSKEEKRTLFFELIAQADKEDTSSSSLEKLMCLINILIMDIADEEEIEKYTDVVEQDLDYPVIEMEELPNSLFSGIQTEDPEDVCDLFFDTLDAVTGNGNAKKAIADFRAQAGDIPVVDYLELLYIERTSPKKYAKKLEECIKKYPDYFLFQLRRQMGLIISEENIFQKNIAANKLKTLLSESKQPITDYELNTFIVFYFGGVILKNTPNKKETIEKIAAFERYLIDNEAMDEDTLEELMPMIYVSKISLLTEVLTE